MAATYIATSLCQKTDLAQKGDDQHRRTSRAALTNASRLLLAQCAAAVSRSKRRASAGIEIAIAGFASESIVVR
jgi:hypothetical protein